MLRQIGKDRACESGDILVDRQTHTQTRSSQYFTTAPVVEVKILVHLAKQPVYTIQKLQCLKEQVVKVI